MESLVRTICSSGGQYWEQPSLMRTASVTFLQADVMERSKAEQQREIRTPCSNFKCC